LKKSLFAGEKTDNGTFILRDNTCDLITQNF
jgi:hypothetical protein